MELDGREKAERIKQLRLINEAARSLPGHKDFCDAMEAALLELEDVATDTVQ